VVEIFAYSDQGIERQYLVSCGNKNAIAIENQRYKDVVPHAVGNHSTIKALEAETLRFAATAYLLSGDDLEEITAFRDYYRAKPSEVVADCIEPLYSRTLATWYRKGRTQVLDQSLGTLLLDMFNFRPEQLEPNTLGHQIVTIGQHMLAAGLV
jgi:hypothetical protein